MNRKTDQNSRWFISDIVRHAKRVMEHNRTTTARLYVTEISRSELAMLRDRFSSVHLDNTGHLVIEAIAGGQ